MMMSIALFALTSSAAMAQTERICAGTTIPAGWVRVNDFNDFFTCGRPISPFIYNVWVIERIDNKFRGDVIVACNGTPPTGWAVKNRFWDPLSCGHPTAIIDNMMILECLNCPVKTDPPQPPRYDGFLDVASCDTIAGWTWFTGTPNQPLRVDILANGSQVAQVMADVFRQDLQNAGKGDGRHGFSFPTPARLKNGQSLAITVRVTNTSFTLNSRTIQCANPIDDAQFFVRQHYIDFLGREPDPSGLNFWTNEITSCGADGACRGYKRVQVSKAFFLSIEFQNTGYYVHRFYRAAFARMPTLAEFGADKNLVSQGVIVGNPGWDTTLNFNKVVFANTFAARSNFTSVYNAFNNQQLVDQLFANAQVTPDTTTRNDLIDGLNTGRYTRGNALRLIIEYQPFISHEFNPAFVMMQYMGYLRRHPSDAPDGPSMPGYFFWLDKLNSTGDQNSMVDAFIKSAEYRNRFGSDQPWPSGSTTKMQAAQMSTTQGYEPIPPCEDWNGDGLCEPPSCEDWDGDGAWDYCW
jgi:hypothetical protein